MNTINKQIQQPSFSSRCPEIRDAQWVCQKVKSFPHISPSKVTVPIVGLAYKNPNVYKRFSKYPYPDLFNIPQEHKITRIFDWQRRIVQKINNARDEWTGKRRGDFRLFEAILGQIKYSKLGNCGEDAFLSATILKLNGVEHTYTATLKIDDLLHDHAVCAFNRNGQPFSGEIKRDTILIDPWIGIADFAANIIPKYKNLYSEFFNGIKPDSKITFDRVKRINLNNNEQFLLKIEYPELLYHKTGRRFMRNQ